MLNQQKEYQIVFVRHGESQWNKENRFTGWTDVPLCESGVEEAKLAGKMLKEKGFEFDVCFTSVLKRAIVTYNIIAEELDIHNIPVIKSWRLNERHYGALQGLNKSETALKHGEDQVKIWRRSYDTRPPPMELNDERYPGNDKKYENIPKDCLPTSECLLDTVNRVLPFWFDQICEQIKLGRRVLVCAHGNSLRAIVKYLDNIPNQEITELNIPTGIPLVYKLDQNFRPINHYYLADEKELKAKMDQVANQGKAK